MSRISRNVSVILRAERLIARAQLAISVKRAGFYIAAGVAVGLAIIMLNLAGFFWLSAILSKPVAAILVAGTNLVLALILVLLANSINQHGDASAAVELRDMALQDIESEIRDSLAEVQNTVAGIRRDPVGVLAPEAITALLSMLLKYARRRKETPNE